MSAAQEVHRLLAERDAARNAVASARAALTEAVGDLTEAQRERDALRREVTQLRERNRHQTETAQWELEQLRNRHEALRAEVERITFDLAAEVLDLESRIVSGDYDTSKAHAEGDRETLAHYHDRLSAALAGHGDPDSGHDPMQAVLAEIAAERNRQDAKWGQQNHPDGTGPDVRYLPFPATDMTGAAASARRRCKANGPAEDNWRDILTEEVYEAFAEDDPATLRRELVQSAAVAVAWIEAIDRRPDSGHDKTTADSEAGGQG